MGLHLPRRLIIVQILILAICAVSVGELACYFPAPSPLIQPFLSPKLRWPTAQIRHWVETGYFDPSYLEFFARDPNRQVPSGDNLVSPADGRVQDVEYRLGKTFVVIGLSFWDVHVVRSPFEGAVESVQLEGASVSRDEPKAELKDSFFLRGKDAPVQAVVDLATGSGKMTVRLITSYWASRLKVWVHVGEHVQKGQRIGRILLGSTVVLELPGKVTLPIKAGQRVTGGETILFSGKVLR